MRIMISSPTRFHLHDLAAELTRLGCAVTTLTAGTRRSLPAELHASAYSAPWLGSLIAVSRLVSVTAFQRHVDWLTINLYDRWASRHVEDNDIVVALSGRGLDTLKRAQLKGALAVCDRGSTHIEHQDAVLRQEYARWGIPFEGLDPRGITRELEEYAAADIVIVPSRFAADTYLSRGLAPAKIAVVPYGIDLTPYASLRRGPEGSGFRLLFVGRLSLQKGLPYVLEAAGQLSREIEGFQLWLVGGMDKDVRRFVEQSASVVVRGHMSRTELLQVYGGASSFVMPSLQEGMATVLLEAMAAGLPVVATAESGASDLIENGREGFIVAPRSPEAIIDSVMKLYLEPELRSAMGAAGRSRAEQFGSLPAYASRAMAAYQRALEKKATLI
jgi:alpha-maltose-1-phosphate synthase